jgi:DNA polymerase III delta prime subunit
MFLKDSLHHAYFIEGEREAVLAKLESFLDKAFKIVRQGHPDVHYAEHESFGIDEGRELQSMQSMKPVAGDKKIFIIVLRSITSEAQNSLLKVFEEPTPGTHFFIISSSQSILLPTLRSRVVVVSHTSARNQNFESEMAEFIKMPLKERLAYVAEMIEEKDKSKAEVFLNALVAELHKKNLKGNEKAIKEIISLSKYIQRTYAI